MEVIEEQLRDSNGMCGTQPPDHTLSHFAPVLRWILVDQCALPVPRCEYAIYVKALIKRQEGQAGEKLLFVKSI